MQHGHSLRAWARSARAIKWLSSLSGGARPLPRSPTQTIGSLGLLTLAAPFPSLPDCNPYAEPQQERSTGHQCNE